LPVATRQLHNCIWGLFANLQNRKFPKNGKTQTCAALPQISIFEKGNEDKLESRISWWFFKSATHPLPAL